MTTPVTYKRRSGGVSTLPLRLLAPLSEPDTYRAVIFLLAQAVLGIGALVLLPLGWGLIVLFAITPLVVPLLIAFRAVVGGLAYANAWLAGPLLGVRVDPPVLSKAGGGFWGRGMNVLRDRAFWRQQAFLLAAWPIALVPVTVLSFAVQVVTVPIWYRWADSSDVFWLSSVDTFPETLPFLAVGLGLLLATAHLVRLFAAVFRRLASGLLGGQGPAMSAEKVHELRLRSLRINAAITGCVDLLLIAIWALTGAGTFWPFWPILALTLVLAIHAWIVLVLEHPEEVKSQPLAIEIGVSVAITLFLVAIWAVTGGGYFWPVWPLLGLGFLVAVHAVLASHWRGKRIEKLEVSRAGAVDVQEAELRRIERDLHDGAQARLVALGMNLGLAEQKLETDPDGVRELLAEARRGATEALEELRDLARGIHPPILTDRGLEAAVAALVARSSVPATLSVDVPERPAPAVEIAAYFVVAEALANAIKYAEATHLDIRIRRTERGLNVEVADDGKGGADPGGNGLTGMRQRVEALDGRLRVASPTGGPTTVTADLP